MIRLSDNYRRRLDSYIEWAKCSSTMTGFPYGERYVPRALTQKETDIATAAHIAGDPAWMVMFQKETYGRQVEAVPIYENLLFMLYARGKAMRDWWSKEKGWWDKEAVYLPEDFLCHLMPDCFYELFGRYPITEIVRLKYDNRYSDLAWRMDNWIKSLIYDGKLVGHERNYRHPWWQIMLRVIIKRRIDGWLWKLRHPMIHWRWTHR